MNEIPGGKGPENTIYKKHPELSFQTTGPDGVDYAAEITSYTP
jgi:hypothetical protein